MKSLNRIRFMSSTLTLALVLMTTIPTISMAAEPTVNLRTTSEFAVLAGSTITNTGTTIISGSVGGKIGLHPGTVFTGQASTSSGAVYLADAVAKVAKEDLVIAYNDADGRLPVTRIDSELGGKTFTPGVYDSADGTFQITGTLTLDAKGDPDGVFIFKTASTLITASGSNINLINSARFCRTFWKVGSSATLGTNSHFVGHIFALESITANTGATVQGQLLARNGAVTLDNNTITNGICEVTTPSVINTPTTTPSAINSPTVNPAPVDVQMPTQDIDVQAPTPDTDVQVPAQDVDVQVPTTDTDIKVPTPYINVPTPTPNIDVPTPTPNIDVPVPQTGQATDYAWAIVFGSLAILLAGAGAIPLVNKSRK